MLSRWVSYTVGAAWPAQRVLGLQPDQPIYRLLVAEDDETNRRLLVRLLRPLGFEVQEVVNGQEAIEVWQCWEPHLIWMDMRMPVMDGYEATRRIKAAPGGKDTVIIALTASAFEEDREKILAAGCDDFMRKPFREEEMFDLLAKHLGVRYVYEEVAAPLLSEAFDHPAWDEDDPELVERLAAQPDEWVSDLQQATTLGDLRQMLQLLDQIL